MSAPDCLRGDLRDYLNQLAFNETQFRYECGRLNDRQLLELFWYMTIASDDDELYVALELQNSDEFAGIVAAVDAVRREATRRGLAAAKPKRRLRRVPT